jgi:acid stress-induced BolA-like protein IbaG/YrbA
MMIEEIQTLPVEERKQLVMAILDSLTQEARVKKHRILEFAGVGAHVRDDNIDAQEYVNQLRSEWDHRQ